MKESLVVLNRPLILGSLCSCSSLMNRFPRIDEYAPMTDAMSDPKFSKAELKVQAVARRRANNQLMRVRWADFHKAYEEYPSWQALVLWVQAVMVTQDAIPSWLLTDLQKRCPGFIEHEATSRETKLVALHILEWVHNHEFGYAKRQGWLDALTFYGVRHPRSESAWAYWEHCEEEWQRKPPSSYPHFEEWLRLARNYNPHPETSVTNLAAILDQYVEWKVFACWLEPLTRAKIELPKRIATELERRCPGFLEVSSSNSTRRRHKKAWTGQRLMNWIEDHFFSDEEKKGWLDIIRQQASTHPLYARIARYPKLWNKSWPQNLAVAYPSFVQWRSAAENYIEE